MDVTCLRREQSGPDNTRKTTELEGKILLELGLTAYRLPHDVSRLSGFMFLASVSVSPPLLWGDSCCRRRSAHKNPQAVGIHVRGFFSFLEWMDRVVWHAVSAPAL